MNAEGLTYMSMIKSNDKLYRKHEHEFAELFGIHLRPFWDNITGFDIVKFDDHIIQSPNGQSMEDVLQAEYGDEGVSIIQSLLKI